MPERELRPNQMMAIVIAAVVIWGAYIALGTYLRPKRGIAEPLVVLAVVVAFVGGWGFLLLRRAGRKK